MILCGASGRGKTYLLSKMLKDNRFLYDKFNEVYLVHPEIDSEPDKHYKEIKFNKIHKEFSQELIKQLADYCKKKFLKKKKKDEDFKMLIILDDCVSSDEMTNKQRSELGKALCNSRKSGLNVIITTQKCSLLPQQVLSQTTHIILYENRFGKEFKTVTDCFGIPDKQEWKRMWGYCFRDFHDTMLVNMNHGIYYRNFVELELKNNINK
jgi:hypothetical protein